MEVINMRLPNKRIQTGPDEGTLQKSDNDMTCGPNYEAEYYRLKEEFEKMKADRDYLAEELKASDRELRWHHGFRTAVEIIFRKPNNYD